LQGKLKLRSTVHRQPAVARLLNVAHANFGPPGIFK